MKNYPYSNHDDIPHTWQEPDPFEGVRLDMLINGTRFARSYDEFVDKLLRAIQEGLNTSDVGKTIIDEILGHALQGHWTPERFQQEKVNVMQACFFLVLDWCEPLRQEFSRHLYNALREEHEK